MNIKKIGLIWLLLFFAMPMAVLSANSANNHQNTPQYLFVISIKSGTVIGNKLTVKTMPQVIYFTDRPQHAAGHVLIKHFVKAWQDEEDLKTTPPNATLSILTKTGANNVVVEIQNAAMKDSNIIFTIKILEGTLPKSFGVASLFIDDVQSSDSIENILHK